MQPSICTQLHIFKISGQLSKESRGKDGREGEMYKANYTCVRNSTCHTGGAQQNVLISWRNEWFTFIFLSEIRACKRRLPGKVSGETSFEFSKIQLLEYIKKNKVIQFHYIWLHIGFKLLHTVDNVTFKPWTKMIFCLVPSQANVSILIIEFKIALFCLLKQWWLYHRTVNHLGSNKDASTVLYKTYRIVCAFCENI